MAEGFEQYVPVDINRSACEAISVYLAGEGMKNGSVVPMATVSCWLYPSPIPVKPLH